MNNTYSYSYNEYKQQLDIYENNKVMASISDVKETDDFQNIMHEEVLNLRNLDLGKRPMDKLEQLRKLALEIDVKRGTDVDTCREDECYEVSTNNMITGITINVEDYELIISKTGEKDMYRIYANNQETGERAEIMVDSQGSMSNIFDFLDTNKIRLRLYSVDLFSIGKFYKPNNNSKLNFINTNEDEETLCYLLRYLQKKGLVEVKTDFDGLPEAIQEWNRISI